MLIRAGMVRPGGSKVGILDLVTGAGAAFAVRRLSRIYTGPCCNIRRSSDNAAQDINFSGWNFDAATFSSFIGAGSGFVTKWYDQSGNGRDASQSTAAAQPQLILNDVNGHPALRFVGSSSQTLLTASFASATSPQTMNGVAIRTSGTAQVWIAAGGPNKNESGFGAANLAEMAATSTATATAADNAWHSITALFNGASSLLNVDGAETSATDGGDLTGTGVFSIGSSGAGTAFLTGDIAEVIMWASALTSAQRSALHSNQSAYYGTN